MKIRYDDSVNESNTANAGLKSGLRGLLSYEAMCHHPSSLASSSYKNNLLSILNLATL